MAVAVNACGPIWRIDGPQPSRPVFGLLQAAEAPAVGVSIVTDVDAEGIERWENGVTLYPYPGNASAGVWAPYAPASERVSKAEGESIANPDFDPMAVYVAETCTSYKVGDFSTWKARAVMALEAIQSHQIAKEFLTGNVLPLNPNLTDGNGVFPNSSTVTNPVNALSLLESAIAASGQLGVIHMSPAMYVALSSFIWFDPMGKVPRSPTGNLIVQDSGYYLLTKDTGVAGSGQFPLGQAAPTGTQEWIFATGPIEIRLSQIISLPDNEAEAMSRGTGGAGSASNSITFRAERYALIDWDQKVQAAVLADRCQTTC